MNYILLTLQKISWSSATTGKSEAKGTSGEDWAYSNRKPQKKVNFFGDEATSFTISRLQKGVKKVTNQSDDLVTIWLNGVNDEEAELYRAEFGDEVYVDSDDNLITVARYEELMAEGTDVADDSTSEQPFA